ncbi:MAG: hypothetical protein RJA36_1341 [Pseudomonadota bacterium]|jgi:xanthine dehydrogenase accessory factor
MSKLPAVAASADPARAAESSQVEPAAVVVTVVATRGSAPREAGAWMAVYAGHQVGTIGGGNLEWQALGIARELLAGGAGLGFRVPLTRRLALGPSLGQCCGGTVELRFERLCGAALTQRLERLEPARTPVAIFGAGHVGRALVRALEPLPFAVRWLDSRDDAFPPELAPQVRTEQSEPLARAVPDLAPASRVLIMSHSHVEDFELVAACLQRQREHGDLAFIGLIGSRTKWAGFRSRLVARGCAGAELAQVRCPIGLDGIAGKEPAVIAASVAAQLLMQRRSG